MLNTRLICHLPLIVPPGCGFRVGGETRRWEDGQAADLRRQRSSMRRGTTAPRLAWSCIFDIWRPELTEQERRGVAAMFEAIDAYRGA